MFLQCLLFEAASLPLGHVTAPGRTLFVRLETYDVSTQLEVAHVFVQQPPLADHFQPRCKISPRKIFVQQGTTCICARNWKHERI